jgi:hypothetical protein
MYIYHLPIIHNTCLTSAYYVKDNCECEYLEQRKRFYTTLIDLFSFIIDLKQLLIVGRCSLVMVLYYTKRIMFQKLYQDSIAVRDTVGGTIDDTSTIQTCQISPVNF